MVQERWHRPLPEAFSYQTTIHSISHSRAIGLSKPKIGKFVQLQSSMRNLIHFLVKNLYERSAIFTVPVEWARPRDSCSTNKELMMGRECEECLRLLLEEIRDEPWKRES